MQPIEFEDGADWNEVVYALPPGVIYIFFDNENQQVVFKTVTEMRMTLEQAKAWHDNLAGNIHRAEFGSN